jgi:hypothetical protein
MMAYTQDSFKGISDDKPFWFNSYQLSDYLKDRKEDSPLHDHLKDYQLAQNLPPSTPAKPPKDITTFNHKTTSEMLKVLPNTLPGDAGWNTKDIPNAPPRKSGKIDPYNEREKI